MICEAIARFLIMSGGILYPSFCSYKAIRLQDPFLYAKWTAYWVTFAMFHTLEQLFDQFSHLIPFYLELKIVLIFWMVSPSSAGSSFIYSHFLHNALSYLENDIELLISGANKLGYSFIAKIFSNSYLFAFSLIFQTKDFALQFLRQQLSVSADPPTATNTNIINQNNNGTSLSQANNTESNIEPHIQTNDPSSSRNLDGGNLKHNSDINIAFATKPSLKITPTNKYNSSVSSQRTNLNQSSANSKSVNSFSNKIVVSPSGSNVKNLEPKVMSYYEKYLKKL